MPFSGFEDFDDCLETMTEEEGHDEESAQNICGALQAEEKADHGDPDALRDALERGRGLVADVGVDLVSGVDVPAVNSKWVMLKSDDESHDYRVNTPILLDKAEGNSEKRISYAAAMIPREPDKEGDVVPTATVERAAHDFLKSDGGIDTDHSLIDGEGDPVESWVLKQERTFDLPNGGTETYPEGTWMLGVEWGAEAWDRIKSGELSGLSIYGMAEHVPLERAATCAECGDSLSASKDANADSDKRDASETSGMGDETPDNGGGDDGGDGGPTVEDVAASVNDLSETVASIKDAVETEKQDPQEAAAELAEMHDMAPGDLLDVVDAASQFDPEDVLAAIDTIDASSDGEEMEASEEAKEDGEDGDDEDDEETEKATETEKRTDDAYLGKGHDGEGVRTEQAKERTGQSGGAGVPSYSDAAAQYEATGTED